MIGRALQAVKQRVEGQRALVQSLELTGAYLRYFGSARDIAPTQRRLVETRLRWRRLVRRTEERGRHLAAAWREDNRVSGGEGDSLLKVKDFPLRGTGTIIS